MLDRAFDFRRRGVFPAAFAFSGVALAAAAALAPQSEASAQNNAAASVVAVHGLISRRIDPAPAGADALRVSVLGDGSGGHLQVRLLSAGEDGVISGYFAPPAIPINFKGWKTLILPLSAFTYQSDTDPASDRDGMGSATTLTSATGVQFSFTAVGSRVFLDDLGWTTAGAAPTDPLLGLIDGFEDAAAVKTAWKVGGDFEEQRAVSFGVAKAADTVKSGSGSLQMVVRSPGLNEQQLYEPQLTVRLKKTPTMPYRAFVRPPYDTITPESTPTALEAQTAPSMRIFAVPGQAEPASFAIYSGAALKGATAALKGSLESAAKKTIPGSAVDIRVVRVGPTVDAPQILMKDDRQPLSGPAPKVRMTGDPSTDIAPGTSKQFWVTVRVPQNQAPGTYMGKIVFSAPGVKPTALPLEVEILPLPLRTAHYQYGIDLLSVIGETGGQTGEQSVSPDILAAQLADIRDHQFKIVAFHGNPASLESALRLYKQAGISASGPIVIASTMHGPDDIAAAEGVRSAAGLGPDFGIYYRLSPDAAKSPDAAHTFGESVHDKASRSALIVAPVTSTSGYTDLAGAIGEPLAPTYSISSDYAQKLLTEGRRINPNHDWWSWSIGRVSPVMDRLFAGFLLFKTGNGLYGAFPGAYQYVPQGMDPYSILNAPDPAAAPSALPQMATFPVEGGVLDTVQWEAVRSGIDDIRYIDILKTYARELKDLKIRKDAVDTAESYLKGVIGQPLLSMTPDKHQAYRRGIAAQALKLQAILQKAGPRG